MKLLSLIEKTGNKLPDPSILFFMGTFLIFALSMIISKLNFSIADHNNNLVIVKNLLSSDGVWWLLSSMVNNFILFPPLGIVLVGMLGIGFAEKTGFLPALLHFVITRIHGHLLTPITMLLGILSSIALDAGYVVLIPIAAALYSSAGRSPLLGIAVSFAGVSAGFSANIFITALDPLLAGFTQIGARIIDPDYVVAVTSNWWFMIASTITLTLIGWYVTERIVDPSVKKIAIKKYENTNSFIQSENSALFYSSLSLVTLLIIFYLFTIYEDAPLYGNGEHFQRWVEVTVPLLFITFFIPGLLYGILSQKINNSHDIAKILGQVLSKLGPYIVLAFFAAQFIATFNYSGLGHVLAIAGGGFLKGLEIDNSLLLSCFILMAVFINLFIGSSSAKYAFFAPVFVPMLMQIGISPELTQVSYRIGDSVSNVITPMNPYMIIILMEVKKYVRGSGLGTVIAMMLPYTISFLIAWLLLLLFWIEMSWPLGPGGALVYQL
jgi:aminobenzoyl-glutamate transport protein